MNQQLPKILWRQPVTRQPLLWVALAFAGGIVAASYAWRPPIWWLIATITFACTSVYFIRSRGLLAFILGLVGLFTLGSLTGQVHTPANPEDIRLLEFADGREVLVTGHVKVEGDFHPYDGGEFRQTVEIETEQISADNETLPAQAGLRIGIYGKQSTTADADNAKHAETTQEIFHYGERIRFPVKLYAPRNYRNPGAFDYRAFLAAKKIIALGSTKRAAVERLPGFAGTRMELWRTRVRRHLFGRIETQWPAEESALVEAILFGDESSLNRGLLADFQRTGTYHVLVVSGLKVAVLVLMIFWALRGLRIGNEWASAITVVLTAAYAVLTDVGAPVWRATLMLMVSLGARFFYRQRSTLNAIGIAALALLILDPGQVFDASFQLSFLCVLIIAGIAVPILGRTTQPFSRAFRYLDSTSYDVLLPPRLAQLRLDIRLIARRLQRFLGGKIPLLLISGLSRTTLFVFEFLLISSAIQIGLVLPMIWYFHRATLTSLPGNIVAVPLTELVMMFSLVAIAASYVWLPLAKIPILIASFALHLMIGSVRWLSKLQISDARVATPQLYLFLLTAGTLVLAMILVRRRPWLAGVGISWMIATTIWICIVPPKPHIHPGTLEVTAIDVGQGDSILLISPQGKTLLVDAGGIPFWMHSDLDIGDEVVSPYLWSRGFSRLDAVVVTHAHADHIGGMAAILENFHPRELWVGVNSPSAELQNLLKEAKDLGIAVVFRNAGDQFDLGGSVVRILAPLAGSQNNERRRNEDSIVMKVSFQDTSALLEGDAERATERQIIEEDPRADLLKVAHHGSATSTLPELLDAVHPRFAVISVGARNTYGHPREEVLQRLGEMNVATYRTDLNGAVTFYLDGKNVSPEVPGIQ